MLRGASRFRTETPGASSANLQEADITTSHPTVPERTPLYDRHLALEARIVDFAGWAMPVQYGGVLEEHRRVREQAGLFDVSHMGEFFFAGPGAAATLDNLATNDVAALADGQALYTALCNATGGVRDDALVYRFDATHFMLVVNAANAAKIAAWSLEHLEPHTDFQDRTREVALLAVQGPRSLEVLESVRLLGPLASRLRQLPYYWFGRGELGGEPLVVSRTGYTGELGFEIFLTPERAGELWDELLERGRVHGLGPAGLGARDTLRFEVCFCLYGHELGEDVTPLESGIGWTVKLRKPRFVGKPALERLKAAGLPRRLVGFEVQDRAIARQGCEIVAGGRIVGLVTSGSFAPTLGRSLAMGLVETGAAAGPLAVRIRGRELPVRLVPMPFYKPAPRS